MGKKHRVEVIDLDNNKTRIKLVNGSLTGKSSYHIKARNLLNDLFRGFIILEEVSLPIRRGEILYADFFIPLLRIGVEIDGSQHTKFNLFFHKNKIGYLKAKKRDRDKEEFYTINNIKLIRLSYNETEDQWKKRLK